jgi:transposase
VIDVALLSVIRRWRLRDGLAIREIARRTGLSRNTIKKYLKSGEVEPKYTARESRGKLLAFEEKLAVWLSTESRKSRTQRRNLRQMYADLVSLGYRGSYDRVAAFARLWHQRQRESAQTAGRGTFVPLVFAPGEAFQFDWSEDWAVVGGERQKLKVAHMKLGHSRAFVMRAYRQETHEMLFDAHNHALRVLGGVPARGLYDNMKTAVDKLGRGKVRVVNARFKALTSHYLFDAEFCNPASGWEKGQVEKQVQDARRRVWHDVPSFTTLAALNVWIEAKCVSLWPSIKHPEQGGRTVAEVWAEERPLLMPLPVPFDAFLEQTKRVSPTCLVAFERHRYSVPSSFANRPVSLRVYAERLVIVAEGEVIAEHERLIARGHDRPSRTVYDWRHYLAVLQRKPGALRNGAPFVELPAAFKRLQSVLLKRPGGDREMVEILALVLHHDEQAVLRAVELALDSGGASKQHVLNLLARLVEPEVPAPIETPPRLQLADEPEANVGRYDRLRGVGHAS